MVSVNVTYQLPVVLQNALLIPSLKTTTRNVVSYGQECEILQFTFSYTKYPLEISDPNSQCPNYKN